MQSMKSTTSGKDLLEEVNKCVAKLWLSFEKLSSVTTDWCLTGKNVGLFKRIQDQKIIFLHCVIRRCCKCVLKMSHVVDTVTEVVNFIRAKSLNHRQFVSLLEESRVMQISPTTQTWDGWVWRCLQWCGTWNRRLLSFCKWKENMWISLNCKIKNGWLILPSPWPSWINSIPNYKARAFLHIRCTALSKTSRENFSWPTK